MFLFLPFCSAVMSRDRERRDWKVTQQFGNEDVFDSDFRIPTAKPLDRDQLKNISVAIKESFESEPKFQALDDKPIIQVSKITKSSCDPIPLSKSSALEASTCLLFAYAAPPSRSRIPVQLPTLEVWY